MTDAGETAPLPMPSRPLKVDSFSVPHFSGFAPKWREWIHAYSAAWSSDEDGADTSEDDDSDLSDDEDEGDSCFEDEGDSGNNMERELELIGKLPSFEQLKLMALQNQPKMPDFAHYRLRVIEYMRNAASIPRPSFPFMWAAVPAATSSLSPDGVLVAEQSQSVAFPNFTPPTDKFRDFWSSKSFSPPLNLRLFARTLSEQVVGPAHSCNRDNCEHVHAQTLPDTVEEATLIALAAAESDLKPTFHSSGARGCEHYIRNCKVHCIVCDKFYACRLCHDDKEEHKLPRPETKYMLCMLCNTPQRASGICSHCHERMADYFCKVCKLWSSDSSKPIFHCHDCGICRLGQGIGIDTFHCHTCGTCRDLAEEDNHRCIEKSTHSNCPICQEWLFNSAQLVLFMRCGHPIHQGCYESMVQESYRCPTCSRSVVDTSAMFRIIDDEVAHEELPDEFLNLRVNILCHDCNGRTRVPFHFAGLKCAICDSYNTRRI